MKILLVVSILFISVGCNWDQTQSQDELAIVAPQTATFNVMNSEEKREAHPHPFQVKFDMVQLEKDVYDFMVSMELNDGAHFISPNAKRDFKGKFTLQFDENQELEMVSDILETPLSVEEFDPHPFVDGYVNWVRENTRYNQKLNRKVENNFHVKGFIQFTIEPRCTLEKVPFIIKYEEGNMRVELWGC